MRSRWGRPRLRVASVASYSGDGRGAGIARLAWLSLPGSWSGARQIAHSQLPKQASRRIGRCTLCGPARPTAEGASAFPSKRQSLGSGNKVIAIFYDAHVRPAIYGDHTGHYGIMQMVDDTCVRAHMEGARHR